MSKYLVITVLALIAGRYVDMPLWQLIVSAGLIGGNVWQIWKYDRE